MSFWGKLSQIFIDPSREKDITLSYADWVEPSVPVPTSEWERKLRNYAKKCSRELTQSRVPLWKSRNPREGKAFFNAFWVVSVDVDQAERFFSLSGTGTAENKSHTGGGIIRGDALILTPLGGLFSFKTEMWFPPSGDHREGDLDSLLYDRSDGLLEYSPWAGLNVGRWRPKSDSIGYRTKSLINRSEFKSRYPPNAFSASNPGKGASIALNKFLKSNGVTQWPRYFDKYYGS